jgi:hypothetical protein
MGKCGILSGVRVILLVFFLACCTLFVPLFSAAHSAASLSLDHELIDCVYTWVDGSDPKWQEIRNTWFQKWYPELANTDANSKNRYRDRDELRYSLRSVAKYAPFFHHIYVVTFGQKPHWLKETERITIVDHQEIFFEKSDLPTFNSQAIEANLHHIPNLTEKFVYFNDDVFLALPCTAHDFFFDDGSICIRLDKFRVPTGPIEEDESLYSLAWRNTNALLNRCFVDEERFVLAHAPFSFTKSLIKEVETAFPDIFKLVSSHKFRMPTDYTLTNGLIPYFAFYNKQGVLLNEAVPLLVVGSDVERNKRRFGKFNKKNCKFFCVQDTGREDNPEVDKQLSDFLKQLYPTAAPWEKEETSGQSTPELLPEEKRQDVNLDDDEEEYDEFHTTFDEDSCDDEKNEPFSPEALYF